jgi:hypothetical protein
VMSAHKDIKYTQVEAEELRWKSWFPTYYQTTTKSLVKSLGVDFVPSITITTITNTLIKGTSRQPSI